MGASPQRYHEYKISRNGVYLGSLQNVGSKFGYTQNVSSVGAQLSIVVDQSADVSELPPDPIRDETGDPILDETGDIIYDERAAEVVGDSNDQILIRNDNDVEVWQFDEYHTNGVIVYKGYISSWEGEWGGDDNIVVTCLNHSQDLAHYITPGSVADSVDQSQTTSDADGYGFWATRTYGQIFRTGSGVGNISKIILRHFLSPQTRTYTVKVWRSVADALAAGTPLGTATATVVGDGTYNLQETTYQFSIPISVTANTDYFFTINVDSGSISGDSNTWGNFDSNTGNPYANGYMYSLTGGAITGDDFWFKTYYTFDSTSITYNNQDPSTVLTTIMNYYISLGGEVSKQTGGYALTGVTVPETSFKINTILEAIQRIFALAPSDWYWYIDPATEQLIFKQTSTTVQHRFIKGTHIENVKIKASKEKITNLGYFTGGKVGAENLFVVVGDAQSLATNRRGLVRITDVTVTDVSTAQLILQNYIDQHGEQDYTSVLRIPYGLYDDTSVNIGDVVAFAGFGSFVDSLQLQVVNKTPDDDMLIITLGVLLPRQTALATQLRQELTALQTIDNPDTPD